MSIITCRSHQARGDIARQNRPSDETLFHYMGGTTGPWRVTSNVAHSGPALPHASHVEIANGELGRRPSGTAWVFRAIARNTRFVTREESRRSPTDGFSIHRNGELCAALILVRKSTSWWNLNP